MLNPLTHVPTISSAIYEDGSDHCGSPLGQAAPEILRNAATGTEKCLGVGVFSTDIKKRLV